MQYNTQSSEGRRHVVWSQLPRQRCATVFRQHYLQSVSLSCTVAGTIRATPTGQLISPTTRGSGFLAPVTRQIGSKLNSRGRAGWRGGGLIGVFLGAGLSFAERLAQARAFLQPIVAGLRRRW
jgi:hypothetical protein